MNDLAGFGDGKTSDAENFVETVRRVCRIAYPVTALIQTVGTGIGMGGAVHYSISHAKGDEQEDKYYIAGTLWLLLLSNAMLTILLSLAGTPVLRLLGASGEVFTIGRDYLTVIILGAVLQIMGTGFVPILRNLGGAACATVFMILGFAANILGDYLLVWQFDMGAPGAAVATIVGQGATMTATIGFLIKKKRLYFSLPKNKTGIFFRNIILVDIAPFGGVFDAEFLADPDQSFFCFLWQRYLKNNEQRDSSK